MTPTAKEIVTSPAWAEMQTRISVALYERFQRTPYDDLPSLAHIRRMVDAVAEVVNELDLMASEK